MTTTLVKINNIVAGNEQPVQKLEKLYDLYEEVGDCLTTGVALTNATRQIEITLDHSTVIDMIVNSNMSDRDKLDKCSKLWVEVRNGTPEAMQLESCMDILTKRITDQFITECKRSQRKILLSVGLVTAGLAGIAFCLCRR